ALGGAVGARLWTAFHASAFTALALLYRAAAFLLFVGTAYSVAYRGEEVWQGLRRALAVPQLRQLAPVWVCMNAIIGLWLGPTLFFLLTNPSAGPQVLSGLMADNPAGLGWLLFGYSLVFATGVVAWSRVLPRIELRGALRVS